MNRGFDDKAEWDKYWTNVQKPESLVGFSGLGLMIMSKEYQTPAGNWESEDKFPVTVGGTQ